MEFKGVLVFGLNIFKGCNIVLLNFQGWVLFSLELPGVQKNTRKSSRLKHVQKGMSSTPPCLDFFQE